MYVWGFWAAVAVLVVGVAATLARAMWKARADTRAPVDFDLAVYRDQLTEIERDIARGTIPADEGARLRTEIKRRLLEADRTARNRVAVVDTKPGLAVAALVSVVLVGAVAVYWRVGAPGYPDLPLKDRLAMSEDIRANRPSQAEAEAGTTLPAARTDVDPTFLDLMEKLRVAVQQRPDELTGLELLARNEAALGNLSAARQAQEAVIRLKGEAVAAEDYAGLAELMVMATGGYVSPEAEQMLVRSLSLDPKNGTARYYSGTMFAQIGRFDQTFILWRSLLEDSTEDAPWVPAIRDQIEEIASRAGVNYTLPDKGGLRGPDAAAMAAAADMTDEDRQAMIAGMVDQLAERLSTEGGSAEEWARLITSLARLGRMDQAREIYAEAQTRFAGQSVELAGIKEAAVSVGVAE
ncbi:MAG: c-type cytochrome biogenesis protein CcmI [Paracoccaceae bacterium]